jgi:hypothetical protein
VRSSSEAANDEKVADMGSRSRRYSQDFDVLDPLARTLPWDTEPGAWRLEVESDWEPDEVTIVPDEDDGTQDPIPDPLDDWVDLLKRN